MDSCTRFILASRSSDCVHACRGLIHWLLGVVRGKRSRGFIRCSISRFDDVGVAFGTDFLGCIAAVAISVSIVVLSF